MCIRLWPIAVCIPVMKLTGIGRMKSDVYSVGHFGGTPLGTYTELKQDEILSVSVHYVGLVLLWNHTLAYDIL